MIRAKVQGLSGLRANLTASANAISGTALDAMIADALQPLKIETETNARALRDPEHPNPRGGHLDQGVVSQKVRPAYVRRRTWWVSFTKRARRIAHLVEFGTAPHDQPKRGIRHPGATPKPFFRRAYEAKKQTVIDILRLRAWTRIRNSVKR
jgi:hypothetical protein